MTDDSLTFTEPRTPDNTGPGDAYLSQWLP